MKSRFRVAALAVSILLAGGVFAGCTTSDENLDQPALTTVASADASGDSTTTEATADESTEEKPKPEKCASLPKDPREQYPNHEAPGRMPARDWDDNNFWIGDIENHYDPCAPISWIIFRGGLGDAERPAHTGASMTDGIAFYVHGEPVDDMTLFTRVESVTTNPDGAVEFIWGERTRSTAEGITAHFTATIEPRDGSMVPVSGNGSEFSARWNDQKAKFLLGHDG